jgi:hypothetical protein
MTMIASPNAVELAAPRGEYARRLSAHQGEAERQLRRYKALAWRRGLTVGIIIILAWLSDKETVNVRVALLIGPALLAIVLMVRRNRAARAWRRASSAAKFYEDRLACLDGRWAGRGDAGTRYLDEDHPTALDLDLFGRGSLFEFLCTARTRPGKDTLAAWLSASAGAEEIRARQTAVRDLQPRLDLREDLAVLGAEVPEGHLADLGGWGRAEMLRLDHRWIIVAAPVAALALAAAGVVIGEMALLLAAVVLQACVSLLLRNQSQRILGPLELARPTLRPLAALLARLEREPCNAPRWRQIDAALSRGGSKASEQLNRLDRLLGFIFAATLLGCRPLLGVCLEIWRGRRGRELTNWLSALCEAEALCSLATHAHENPDAFFPEIVGNEACFQAEGLGHPLLPRDRCVANDVALTGDLRLLVVSGSNMSGKSTLLRTVGVNAALALAGAPVRAGRLRLCPLALGATLRVQDSLQAGRSRFFAEALRVRRLLELAEGPLPLLFLLDELFQGTNSHDRRVGAEAILRRLLDHGAIGLVTTHDLALSEIADRLAPRAANVHFEDRFADGSITFDYCLRPGVVPTSNGLALLRSVGIEV